MSHAVPRVLRYAMSIAAVAALAAPAGASALSFQRSDFTTGDLGGPGVEETGATTADFTGDGRPDVVVTGQYSSLGPRLMRNLGGGAFSSPGTQIPLGFDVGTVVAGDLNGDGNADLVAGNDAQIITLLGHGDGTFTTTGTYTVLQGGQTDVQVADVNGDGRADVTVLLRYGVKTLLGNGNGTLRSGPTTFIPSPFMSGIDLANFNGDGRPDLVAADAGAQRVYRLDGDGDGSFTLKTSALTGLVPGTILAGDLNHDGRDDVVALHEFNFVKSAAVLLSTASGFAPAKYYDGGLNPASGALGDIDGDGNLDIVSSDTTASAQVVLLGNGAGAFTTAVKAPVASYPQTPVVADFDGDGRADIAAAGAANAVAAGQITLSVLTNQG